MACTWRIVRLFEKIGEMSVVSVKAVAKNVRVRNYVFTVNKPTANERAMWTDLALHGGKDISYVLFKEERGMRDDGTLGNLHLQGYIELKKAVLLSTMKRLFGQRVHFEARRGSQKQAIDYVKKRSTTVEGGLDACARNWIS